jgi:peptidoglycan/LPS O-acetylase OafA/YrhL
MGITWSLAIEEQFYLFFPLAVYFLPRRWITFAVLAGICIAPIMRYLVEQLFGNWYAAYVLMPSRMDALLFGVLVALIVRNENALAAARRVRWFLDAIMLYLAYCIATYSSLFLIWPSPTGGPFPPLKQSGLALMFALLILHIFIYRSSALRTVLRARILANIGLISYALYMYHQAVNGLMHGFLFNQEPKVTSIAELLVAIAVMAISIGLATLSYFYFELPIRKIGQRLTTRVSDPGVWTTTSDDKIPSYLQERSVAPS